VEALRVVVVALPARRPLVDGHNLVIVFFVLRESGEGEKKRRRKKWERNALRQLLLIFSLRPLVSYLLPSLLLTLNPCPTAGLISTGSPFSTFIHSLFEKEGNRKGKEGAVVVSVFCFAPNSLVLVEKGSPFLFLSFLSLSLSLPLPLLLTPRGACSLACRRRESRSGRGGWCCRRRWRREPFCFKRSFRNGSSSGGEDFLFIRSFQVIETKKLSHSKKTKKTRRKKENFDDGLNSTSNRFLSSLSFPSCDDAPPRRHSCRHCGGPRSAKGSSETQQEAH